jgi:BirA family biotin operon repressor/biotin-[acetyl-CoA-carboxylase] ligase
MLPLVGGFRLLSLPEIDSTNSEAQRRAEAGEKPGLAITAERQTSGRGQHGRAWQSPEGNLPVSTLVKPALLPAQIGQLAFVAAVACAETIDYFLGSKRTQLKWPNDLLVDNAKLGGILIESELGEHEIEWAIIGIGLNIAVAPENLAYRTTSLNAASGRSNAVSDVLASLLQNLFQRLTQLEQDSFAPIRAAWESHAWRLGQPVRITAGLRDLTGSFTALDHDGALVLTTASGPERITAGSLSYESAA